MAVYLTKSSARELRKCKVSESALIDAVLRAQAGNIDAQLDATLIKQEVARPPEGRKTACRAIVAIKSGARHAVVMHVYAKSAKADLTPRESEAYADLSKQIVELSDRQLDDLVRDRGWKIIGHE